MKRHLNIVVCGMVAGDPWQGGATWAVMQYVIGLQRLGHSVLLVEPINQNSLRPSGCTFAGSENASYFNDVATEFGLRSSSALLLCSTQETIGVCFDDVAKFTRKADVLFNISGMLTDENLTSHIPIRVYVDLDPAFNQLWSAVEGLDMRFEGHTHFVTVGQGIGEANCHIPTCGLKWLKTLPPVVLPEWPAASGLRYDSLTTVANWRGYGSIHHNGVCYGQKAHSLRGLVDLPTRTTEKFALALAIHPEETKDLEALRRNRWQVLSPSVVAGTPGKYRHFVQISKAEFGLAKSGYVASQCGWFSDRSACYLASGRPVLAQDTGFSRHLPTGTGLLSFKTAEEALDSIDALNADYAKHSSKARVLAEEYFDSEKVLNQLLKSVDA